MDPPAACAGVHLSCPARVAAEQPASVLLGHFSRPVTAAAIDEDRLDVLGMLQIGQNVFQMRCFIQCRDNDGDSRLVRRRAGSTLNPLPDRQVLRAVDVAKRLERDTERANSAARRRLSRSTRSLPHGMEANSPGISRCRPIR